MLSRHSSLATYSEASIIDGYYLEEDVADEGPPSSLGNIARSASAYAGDGGRWLEERIRRRVLSLPSISRLQYCTMMATESPLPVTQSPVCYSHEKNTLRMFKKILHLYYSASCGEQFRVGLWPGPLPPVLALGGAGLRPAPSLFSVSQASEPNLSPIRSLSFSEEFVAEKRLNEDMRSLSVQDLARNGSLSVSFETHWPPLKLPFHLMEDYETLFAEPESNDYIVYEQESAVDRGGLARSASVLPDAEAGPKNRLILAATLMKLVEKLSLTLDYEFMADFMMTYRKICSPFELANLLLARFKWSLLASTDTHRIVRVRIFVILRHWFENYYVMDLHSDPISHRAEALETRQLLEAALKAATLHPLLSSPRDQRMIFKLLALLHPDFQGPAQKGGLYRSFHLAHRKRYAESQRSSSVSMGEDGTGATGGLHKFSWTKKISSKLAAKLKRATHMTASALLSESASRQGTLPTASSFQSDQSSLVLPDDDHSLVFHQGQAQFTDTASSMSNASARFGSRRRSSILIYDCEMPPKALQTATSTISVPARGVTGMHPSLLDTFDIPPSIKERILADGSTKKPASEPSQVQNVGSSPANLGGNFLLHRATQVGYTGAGSLAVRSMNELDSGRRHLDPSYSSASLPSLSSHQAAPFRPLPVTIYAQPIDWILDYEKTDHIAQQLCLIEWELLNAVDWIELLTLSWIKPSSSPTGPQTPLLHLIDRFNKTCTWVASEVIAKGTPHARARMIEKFVRICIKCLESNNYNTVVEIVLGLQNPYIERLKKTWRLVSDYEFKILQDLILLTSPLKNFKRLRETLDPLDVIRQPCVPFTGMFLSDLVFTSEMPDYVSQEPVMARSDPHGLLTPPDSTLETSDTRHGSKPASQRQSYISCRNPATPLPLVNFQKCRAQASIIKRFMGFQSSEEGDRVYRFQKRSDLYVRLLDLPLLDPETLRRKSKELES